MNNTVTLPRELAEMIERTWRARLPLGQDNVVHGLIRLRLILAQQAEPRCEYCDGTGDVHRADGEWLGECKECDAAEPAPAQDEPVYQLQRLGAPAGWRDADKEAYDSAVKMDGYLRRTLYRRPAQTEQQPDDEPDPFGLIYRIDGEAVIQLVGDPHIADGMAVYAAPIAQTVIIPERKQKGWQCEQGIYPADGWNAALDEVARLNAQTEQQPCGYQYQAPDGVWFPIAKSMIAEAEEHGHKVRPVYAAPIAHTAPQPEQSGLVEALPYQTLFNAIAAATKSIPGTSHISISVEAFRAALSAQGGDA